MRTTNATILRKYRSGDAVSISAIIRAGILVETEATKMLTAQINDTTHLTPQERSKIRTRIMRAGYAVEITGNMDRPRVYEVTE